MSDQQGKPGMLQQLTYRKVLPNVKEQGGDICLYVDNIENNRGEEITRMVDAQQILLIFEATHIDARVNRVQEIHLIGQWQHMPMEWLKNRTIEKYHDMRMHGLMIGIDNKIKLKAVQRVRLI
jgi:hypothetical protein